MVSGASKLPGRVRLLPGQVPVLSRVGFSPLLLSHHSSSPITLTLPSLLLSHHSYSPITLTLPSLLLSHHSYSPITLTLPSHHSYSHYSPITYSPHSYSHHPYSLHSYSLPSLLLSPVNSYSHTYSPITLTLPAPFLLSYLPITSYS